MSTETTENVFDTKNVTHFNFADCNPLSKKYTNMRKAFLKNQDGGVFDLVLFFISFGVFDGKKLFGKDRKKLVNDQHEISYGSEKVEEFLKLLNAARFDVGLSDENYVKVWKSMEDDRELATVFVVVVFGYLILVEDQYLQSIEDVKYVKKEKDESISFMKVVNLFRMGKYRFDEHHQLIKKRKEALEKQAKKSSLGFALDDTKFGSFTQNPEYLDDDMGFEFTEKEIQERKTMVLSLFFVILLFDFDKDNATLLNILEMCILCRKKHYLAHESRNSEDVEIVVDTKPINSILLLLENQVDWNAVTENDTSLFQYDLTDPATVVDSISFQKLRGFIKDPENTESIVQHLEHLLISPDKNVLKVFQFVRFLLPQIFIKKNQEFLLRETIMKMAKEKFIKPMPLGGIARDILQICSSKILNPGHYLRKVMHQNLRKVRGAEGDETILKRKKIFVFYNPYSQNAKELQQKLLPKIVSPDDRSDVIQATANLVLNVFENYCPEDLTELMSCYSEVLDAHFEKMYELMLKTKRQEKRRDGLRLLKQSIVAHQKNSSNGTQIVRDAYPEIPPPALEMITLPQEFELMQCEIIGKIHPCNAIVENLESLVENSIAELPTNVKEITIPIALAGGSGTCQRFAHALVVFDKHIHRKKFKDFEVNFSLYLLPIGMNNHLSNWLSKYDPLYGRYHHNPIVSPLNIFPTLKAQNEQKLRKNSWNAMMKQLAKKPLSRHSFTFAPVATYQQIAKVRLRDRPSQIDDITCPITHHNSLLNYYFTHAQDHVPVYCYTAQLFFMGQTARGQYGVVKVITIGFCQRAEIGVVAEAVRYQQSNDNLKGKTIDEVVSDPGFSYKGQPMDISYVPMDPSGGYEDSCKVAIAKDSLISTISMKSCSVAGDIGPLANPCQPWLEVFTEDKVSKSRKTKLRDIDYAGNTYHVKVMNISVAQGSDPLHILLDGELFGPVQRISIGPFESKNKELLRFNLHTFMKPHIIIE